MSALPYGIAGADCIEVRYPRPLPEGISFDSRFDTEYHQPIL